MTSPRALLATALVVSMFGCGTDKQTDGQGQTTERMAAKIKAGEQNVFDGGVDGTETGTVTFTTTGTETQTQSSVVTLTTTTSATSTSAQVVTSTETLTTTETTTGTSTSTQTAATTATTTTTSTSTWTETVTASRTYTATASQTTTGTQTGTITQTASQTRSQAVTITVTTTGTATYTVPSVSTQTVTTSSTTTSTGTLSTVATVTRTYVLSGPLTSTNTATVSNLSWSKFLGNTHTATTTQYLLGSASKVVTTTLTSPLNGTETRTVTGVITSTGAASGTTTLTATATRTQGSNYYGAGSKTLISVKTATNAGTQYWTYHPTGTLTQTLTGTATQTQSYPGTATTTVTLTGTSTAVTTTTGTATLTLSVTNTVTNTTTVTNTATQTDTSTVTKTNTLTNTVTVTNTVTNTLTQSFSNTTTSTQTSAATHVETVTGTSTSTGTTTGTVAETSTVTSTMTRTETVTSCAPGYIGPGVIDGSVILGQTHQISDLQGVWCITDTLDINYTSLTDLSGLESLAVVGNFIYISSNYALTSLKGLENLQSTTSLEISNNPALTSLAGLARLRHLSSDPMIQSNGSLPNCWAREIARQTNTSAANCHGNWGTGTCGTLPDGFVCAPGASGPGVLDGDLYVDPWVADLRDYSGITCITGSVGISYTSLANLFGLESLTAIGGSLTIQNNTALTAVSGLDNLKSIGGGLSVSYNPALASLAGLANLRSLGSNPWIAGNQALPACWGWEIARLTNTSKDTCFDNRGTGSCGTLPEGFVCQPGATGPGVLDLDVDIQSWVRDLTDFGGVTCITGNLGISYASLTNLSGFETLVEVGGSLNMQYNSTLTTVNGLDSLKSVGGALSIQYNTALTSLAGLGKLRSLGSNPSIAGNLALPACWAWEIARLTNTNSDSFFGNRGSGNCGALPEGFVCQPGASGPGVLDRDVNVGSWGADPSDFGGLACVTGNLEISYTSLTDVTGLVSLVAVGGSLTIQNNQYLTAVSGLVNLKSVGGGLTIAYNSALTSLAGLAGLQTLGSDPWISNNWQLPACWADQIAQQTSRACASCWGNGGTASCQGSSDGTVNGPVSLVSPADIQRLANVTRIRGDLTVASGGTLTDLVGLESLVQVDGNLVISETSLVSLQGLEHLTTVTGRVQIMANYALTSLDGLSTLASAGEFHVSGNGALTRASVPALASVNAWDMSGNTVLPQCWPLVLEQQLGKGCSNCAYTNHGGGACPAPVDGWIDQTGYSEGGYIITFAGGGAVGSFMTMAEAHAMYPDRVLAAPVPDGEVYAIDGSGYMVTFYTGWSECCHATAQEAVNAYAPSLLLRVLP